MLVDIVKFASMSAELVHKMRGGGCNLTGFCNDSYHWDVKFKVG